MLFNSFDFAVFLPLVFSIYWIIGGARLKLQNAFLLFASYVFYGWWDWRFLALIMSSSLIDYFVGLALTKDQSTKIRKLLLAASLTLNLSILGFFKYCTEKFHNTEKFGQDLQD